MNQEFIQNNQAKSDEESSQNSFDSGEFQQLQLIENSSINRKLEQEESKNMVFTYIEQQQKITTKARIQLQNKLKQIEKQLKQQQIELQEQKKLKNNFLSLYEASVAQTKVLKQKLNTHITQNSKLKQINIQLKQLIQNLKQQGQQYIDKINCLQKKIQLQKEDLENKFIVIKKNVQIFTKVPVRNIDNENLIKFLVNKFSQMEKITNKIGQLDDMILDKTQKTKTGTEAIQILPQKLNVLEKIQSILVKQQNRINNLRQQIIKTQEQLIQSKKNNKSGGLGFGKIFDPVMKFCKVEQIKQIENKKRKDIM